MSTTVLYVHFQTVCHDVSVESGRRACVRKSVYLCTREPADRGLQGEAFMEPALVNALVSVRVSMCSTLLAVSAQLR